MATATVSTTGFGDMLRLIRVQLREVGSVKGVEFVVPGDHIAPDRKKANVVKLGLIYGVNKAAGRNPWYFTAKEQRSLALALAKALKRRDLAGGMRKIAELGIKYMKAHFASQKNPDGSTFTPLAPGYARRKAKRSPGKKILTDTEQLINSLIARPIV